MAFFNNIGIEIKEHAHDVIVKVGTPGKYKYMDVHTENRRITNTEDIVRLIPKDYPLVFKDDSNQSDEELRAKLNDILSKDPMSLFNWVRGRQITTEWDDVHDEHEVIYMTCSIEELKKNMTVKRKDAVDRRVCKECAFKGHCNFAPACGIKYPEDEDMQVYFKKASDTIIDTQVFERSNTSDTSLTMNRGYFTYRNDIWF